MFCFDLFQIKLQYCVVVLQNWILKLNASQFISSLMILPKLVPYHWNHKMRIELFSTFCNNFLILKQCIINGFNKLTWFYIWILFCYHKIYNAKTCDGKLKLTCLTRKKLENFNFKLITETVGTSTTTISKCWEE